jgi:hypothetical protein
MKPAYGRYQAATKVNVLSPEIVVIEKVHSMQVLEGNMSMSSISEFMGTFPGSEAAARCRTDRVGTWVPRSDFRKGYPPTSRKGRGNGDV